MSALPYRLNNCERCSLRRPNLRRTKSWVRFLEELLPFTEAKIESQDLVHYLQSAKKQTKVRSTLLYCTSLVLFLFVLGVYIVLRVSPSQVNLLPRNCLEPKIRREWLSRSEKASYIAAVKCLTEIAPRSRENETAYD